MNFFDPAYQEAPITDIRFGLCDDKDGTAAYTDKTNESKWIAVVKNEQRMPIIFTAIDKGVIKDTEYSDRGRCDGMLASDSHLFFFELKNERQGWIEKAVSQLESTIQFFNDAHVGKLDTYKHKKAFACNRKHPHFIDIDKETVLYFFRTYRVRLDIQAEIKFKK